MEIDQHKYKPCYPALILHGAIQNQNIVFEQN